MFKEMFPFRTVKSQMNIFLLITPQGSSEPSDWNGFVYRHVRSLPANQKYKKQFAAAWRVGNFSFVMLQFHGLVLRKNCNWLLCSDNLNMSLVWQDWQSQDHVPDSPCGRHQPPGQMLAASPPVDHGPDGGVFPTGTSVTLWANVTVHIDMLIFLTQRWLVNWPQYIFGTPGKLY